MGGLRAPDAAGNAVYGGLSPTCSELLLGRLQHLPRVVLVGTHTLMDDKSQTSSVEGTNADLRHYLARLARRSRCFSRCLEALRRAVDLFVRFYNAR